MPINENPCQFNQLDLKASDSEFLELQAEQTKQGQHSVSTLPTSFQLEQEQYVRSIIIRYTHPFLRSKRPLVPLYKGAISRLDLWLELHSDEIDRFLQS